jgi:hypothetical protein
VDNKNVAGPEEPEYDPCANVQPLIDHANRVFRHQYVPHQQLSFKESTVEQSITHSCWDIYQKITTIIGE